MKSKVKRQKAKWFESKVKSKKSKFGHFFSFFVLTFYFAAALPLCAQSGGDFEIKKPTVSAGGGKTENGAFVVTTVIGQSAAGGRLTNLPFQIATGFFSANFAPTAAAVSVGGRVLDQFGMPVSRARVTMSGSAGVPHSALTNSFGYFRFDDVPVGETYIIEVVHKRYVFAPRVISVSDEITDLELVGVEN